MLRCGLDMIEAINFWRTDVGKLVFPQNFEAGQLGGAHGLEYRRSSYTGSAHRRSGGRGGSGSGSVLGKRWLAQRRCFDTNVDPNHFGRDPETGLQLPQFQEPDVQISDLSCRVGIHCGACVGAIVGNEMQRYHLFGRALRVLEKLEASSQPGRAHISNAVMSTLKKTREVMISDEFSFEQRFGGLETSKGRNLSHQFQGVIIAIPHWYLRF